MGDQLQLGQKNANENTQQMAVSILCPAGNYLCQVNLNLPKVTKVKYLGIAHYVTLILVVMG